MCFAQGAINRTRQPSQAELVANATESYRRNQINTGYGGGDPVGRITGQAANQNQPSVILKRLMGS